MASSEKHNVDKTGIRPDGYIPRIVDDQVQRYLSLFGAVEISGTKWCGKTWTARAHGESITYVDQGDNLEIAKADPLLMLEGDHPHVIDEWQQAPAIWNAVRHEIDQARKLRGAWILTGSSTPSHEEDRHSGAGRIGRIRMFPMTLSESGDSSKSVSLSSMFEGKFEPASVACDTRSLVGLCCRGGWPETFDDDVESAQAIAREYLRSIYEQGAPSHGKNPATTERLIRSLARNIGQSPTYGTLIRDMGDESGAAISEKTVADYMDFLKRIYLVQDVEGWVPPTRSPKRLRMKPKHYFADPSLPVAALGLSPDGLVKDWQTFGLIFENLCMRDLIVYASALPNIGSVPVRYYRDDNGLEVDAIIELNDGAWAAFEIKVSESKVDAAVSNLKRLRSKLAENEAARMRPPAFMAVITGTGKFARKEDDGIYVIPITLLTV